MSKENKLEKKAAKVANKAAKAEKKQAAAYAKLVKKIQKKNTKLEAKSTKKGTPFVPLAIPDQEEAFAATGSKGGNIAKLIILIILIWFLIYFIVMWMQYVAPVKAVDGDGDGTKTVQEYDKYSNPHKITTTPNYSVGEAQMLLKQVIHDNYRTLGYSSDPSTGSISNTSSKQKVYNTDCYMFSVGGKTYAVSVKLSSVYVNQNGTYEPITFNQTDYLF